MKRLTTEQLKQYVQNPSHMDEQVRKWCNLPEDKYYTVSTWPEEVAGNVYVTNVYRVVKAKKISKSDQK
jgi:hypothetical protein